MNAQPARAAIIAAQNDLFRLEGASTTLRGLVNVSPGVATLPFPLMEMILASVMAFNRFTPENDPNGEHDSGAVLMQGAEEVFWSIDYYASDEIEELSADPADPAQTFRVLTLRLASED